jgi:hypothetical protein
VSAAIDVLRDGVPDVALHDWYDAHAQHTFKWRCIKRGILKATPHLETERGGVVGPPDGPLARQVYERDSYRCSYCQNRLLAIPALEWLEAAVGRAYFRTKGSGNAVKSGAAMVLRPVADHVFPASRGGQPDMDNLVTSCWPCNFGKNEFTCGDLGIADPRLHPADADGWMGMRTPVRG